MLELKSSLKLQPKVVRAIVLVSCHRKAKDANTLKYTEYMNQGLTQKQGAGIIDLYNDVRVKRFLPPTDAYRLQMILIL